MTVSKRKRVRVTAYDIAAGERRNCMACPVALALCRALELGGNRGPEYVGKFLVKTNAWYITIHRVGEGQSKVSSEKLLQIDQSVSATTPIQVYDRTGEMKPFEFWLPAKFIAAVEKLKSESPAYNPNVKGPEVRLRTNANP